MSDGGRPGHDDDSHRVRIATDVHEPPRVRVGDASEGATRNVRVSRDESTILDKAKASPITALLVAVNVAVFLWAASTGDTTTNATLLRFGAVEPLHVWKGQYWRLATCMFMHIGWIHIAWNTYAGVGWCASVERSLGKWRFLLVYLASGLAGGSVSVLGAWLTSRGHISAGASGAMFGMVGATFAIRLHQLGSFKLFREDRAVRATLLNIGIWTLIGFSLHVDNWAHGGGLLAGGITTWLFVRRASAGRWVVFTVAYVAFVVAAARPWHKATEDDFCRLYEEICKSMPTGTTHAPASDLER